MKADDTATGDNPNTRYPFDLERALAGEVMVTRDGKTVVGLKLRPDATYTYPFVYELPDGKTYTERGTFHVASPCGRDLFMLYPSMEERNPNTTYPFDLERALAGEEMVTRAGELVRGFRKIGPDDGDLYPVDDVLYPYVTPKNKHTYNCNGDYTLVKKHDNDLFMRSGPTADPDPDKWYTRILVEISTVMNVSRDEVDLALRGSSSLPGTSAGWFFNATMTADNKPEPEESDVPAPHVLPPLLRNARNPFEAFFHRQIVLIAGDARVEVPLGLHANTLSSKEDFIARADALVGGPVGFGPHKDETVQDYAYREHGNGPATGRRFAIVPGAVGLLVRSIRHAAADETRNPVLPYDGHIGFLRRNIGKVFHEVPAYSHPHTTFATLVESPGDEGRYAIPRFCVELVDP